MTITLLCPTRARPEQCKRMIDSVAATASTTINICLGFTQTCMDEYKIQLGPYKNSSVTISQYIYPDNMPTVFKWNNMAEHRLGFDPACTLFMLAADDIIFTTPEWDKALLEHYDKLGDKHHVYALRDSRDFDGTPHPICTRQYVEAMGFFLPPLFLHWFVDSWTVEIAKHNKCFTHMPDYELVHDKPFHRGEPDDTHMRIRVHGWLNNDQWTNMKCQHFLALEKSRLKMRMA